MSFDDDVMLEMHRDLFATFGVDGTVQRGAAAPQPVRIVVDRGQERLGEYGQAVSRATTVEFLCAQWQPRDGDVVAWTDRLGAHQRRVEAFDGDDGFVARAVLHG